MGFVIDHCSPSEHAMRPMAHFRGGERDCVGLFNEGHDGVSVCEAPQVCRRQLKRLFTVD